MATLDVGEDADLADRVARHRARRPAAWSTVEAGVDLPGVLRGGAGAALVDSLGPWVSALARHGGRRRGLVRGLDERAPVTQWWCRRRWAWLCIPPLRRDGASRDAMGTVNQTVAAFADEVVLVVAGRVLRLDDVEGRP